MEHNPDINWHTGKVELTCCPDYCGQAESDSSCPDNNILVHLVEATSETLERIYAMTTISMQLAKVAKEDTSLPNSRTHEGLLLKPNLSFWDAPTAHAFSATQLPPSSHSLSSSGCVAFTCLGMIFAKLCGTHHPCHMSCGHGACPFPASPRSTRRSCPHRSSGTLHATASMTLVCP